MHLYICMHVSVVVHPTMRPLDTATNQVDELPALAASVVEDNYKHVIRRLGSSPLKPDFLGMPDKCAQVCPMEHPSKRGRCCSTRANL